MNDNIDREIHDTRAFLAARATPDFRASVMDRLEDLEPLAPSRRSAAIARLVDLLWAPREVSVRPAWAMAAVGVIAAVLLAPFVRPTPSAPPQVVRSAVDPHVFVQFRLDAMASRVQLAGSFTNWEPRYELRESAPGVWTITVPLTEGVHDYAFVVDGQQWVADPHAPQIGDGFGGTNNRLALLSPDTPRL